ncbi:Transcription factor, MADS-box [Dillenia turbinata]|uniref:Transcription factor, MADS-box n=1 Tax=Dillenia turbinata TaxID=194707 RepID=A0AAN8UHJ3_9MAGN
MTKKVKFAFIADDAARKSAFRKRKRGLLKKTEELSTLCGIEACTVIFGPYEPRPSVWASAPGAEYVLGKFMSLPEMEKSKKMMSLEEFIRQRLKKTQEHLGTQLKENRVRVITQIMNQCLVGRPVSGLGNLDDLNDLAWLLNKKNEEMTQRLEIMGQPPPLPPPLPLPVQPPPPPPNVVVTTSATLASSHPLPLPYHPQMGMENLAAAAAAAAAGGGGPRPGWTSMNSININDQHISPGGVSDDMMLPYVHPNNPGNNSGMGPGPSFR